MQQPQPPQQNYGQGRFDMGDGYHLQVKVNGKTPENYLKDRASGMIFGWILGAVILGLVVVITVGVGIYVYVVAKDTSSPSTRSAVAATWDGRTPYLCSANDAVTLTGVTATAGVVASGNCKLTLNGVNISAPIPIEATGNAKVTVVGGSVTGGTSSVVATGGAKVDFVGTKVVGKSKTSGGAKITGAP